MQPCVYRDLADEAARIDAETGGIERVEAWLCTWPTTINPMPAWFRSKVGPSPVIVPETDCINCAVRNAG